MAKDPLRLFDAQDIQAAVLYAKRVASDTADAYPVLVNTDGSLIVSVTSGNLTFSQATTAVTVSNAVGSPVNVSLTSTKVTIESSSGLTVTPSTTASTITNAVGNPVNVSLTSTVVTVSNLQNVTASVSTIPIVGRTLTTASGSINATSGTLSFTPTNRAKVYAFSLTTTSASEVIAIFFTGGGSTGLELWRATLMTTAGNNTGANLAVPPPAFLFASRTASAVSLSLSTAVLVHYSISYFDEA